MWFPCFLSVFLSNIISNPSISPVNYTFKMYLESGSFSPTSLLLLWSKPPSSLPWTIAIAAYQISLLLLCASGPISSQHSGQNASLKMKVRACPSWLLVSLKVKITPSLYNGLERFYMIWPQPTPSPLSLLFLPELIAYYETSSVADSLISFA